MPGQAPLVRAFLDEADRHKPGTALPSTFRVFARVRPLHARELASGEYDAIDTNDAKGARRASGCSLVAHDARLARSGRRLSMLHRWYSCDGLYGPAATDGEVHGGVLAPMLRRVVSGQGDATVVLYGQTGGGKTHTLMGMISRVQEELDRLCAAARLP
eukprot:1379534-Prymnesium_polylepis.2